MKAEIWRNHPGLSGQDGIGIRGTDGVTRWYTVERAREIVGALADGIAQLEAETGDSRGETAHLGKNQTHG
jgi:hypothetical protein